MNNIEMYSTYNEWNPVVAETFIRTLKNKLFKHMAAISKNVYFDALDDIVDKRNNTVHKTIKIKLIDVTDGCECDKACECNKACDVGEYLGYEKCNWRMRLVGKLVDECTETVEEVKLVK